MDCIFCNIISGDIPSRIVYEDEHVLAFDDIAPKAPIHKLIVPRSHISTLNELNDENQSIIGHMTYVASSLAKKLSIAENGYRIIMNCNEDGGQTVFHIHMHLIGGRKLSW